MKIIVYFPRIISDTNARASYWYEARMAYVTLKLINSKRCFENAVIKKREKIESTILNLCPMIFNFCFFTTEEE